MYTNATASSAASEPSSATATSWLSTVFACVRMRALPLCRTPDEAGGNRAGTTLWRVERVGWQLHRGEGLGRELRNAAAAERQHISRMCDELFNPNTRAGHAGPPASMSKLAEAARSSAQVDLDAVRAETSAARSVKEETKPSSKPARKASSVAPDADGFEDAPPPPPPATITTTAPPRRRPWWLKLLVLFVVAGLGFVYYEVRS